MWNENMGNILEKQAFIDINQGSSADHNIVILTHTLTQKGVTDRIHSNK
jgi:hypothetical protein